MSSLSFGTALPFACLSVEWRGGGRKMWSVVSEENVFEFPRFEQAMMFADEFWRERVKLIDARTRVISIVQSDDLLKKEVA